MIKCCGSLWGGGFAEERLELFGVLQTQFDLPDFPFFQVHLRNEVLPDVAADGFDVGGHETGVVDVPPVAYRNGLVQGTGT